MEIEKSLTLDVPPQKVWEFVLDPEAMCGCVPDMQSVEVVSDTQYVAHMQVKISFISARFTLDTHIVEQDPPHYLRAEGTGEDTSVASSLKQTSEMFLEEREDGGTELRIKIQADVFGRLGTFGLAVMKTKADRMWDEFGVNLTRCLNGEPVPEAAATVASPPRDAAPAPRANVSAPPAAEGRPARVSWWSRLLGRAPTASANHIHIELDQGATRLRIDWPAHRADECRDWLSEVVKA